jgi:hypothetical protein
MPFATSVVSVHFVDKNGIVNTAYSANLSDKRKHAKIEMFGDRSALSSAQMFVDSAYATSTAGFKPFQLAQTTLIGSETTVNPATDCVYGFVDDTKYSLKMKLEVAASGAPLYGEFVVNGMNVGRSYTYHHDEEGGNTIGTAVVSNPLALETGEDLAMEIVMANKNVSAAKGNNTFTIQSAGFTSTNPVTVTIPDGLYDESGFVDAVTDALNAEALALQWTGGALLVWQTSFNGKNMTFANTTAKPAAMLAATAAINIDFPDETTALTFGSGSLALTLTYGIGAQGSAATTSGAISNVDWRVPSEVMITLDRCELYPADIDDNAEGLEVWSSRAAYNRNNTYTFSNIEAPNDAKNAINATAIYKDGHSTSKTVTEPAYIVAAPVINTANSVAYGLDDKLDAGVPETATVAIINLEPGSTPLNIPLYDGNVTFNFNQGTNLCYTAVKPANNVTNEYTISFGNLVKEYTTVDPVQNADAAGSYNFDVTAVVTYSKVGGAETGTFTKTSNIWTATFTQDVISVTSVTLANAWVNAAVTEVDGQQIVDNDDSTSMDGYGKAPDFGLVGKFPKHNQFGTGVVGDVYDRDLDTIDTIFKFEYTVNGGTTMAVPALALMQGSSVGGPGAYTTTDQENYIALLDETISATADGGVANIPYNSAVLGTEQPSMYFSIPSVWGSSPNVVTLFGQGDDVVVTISIESAAKKGITLAPGKDSNEVTVVRKVATYTMVIGEDSEPSMSNGVLTVPVDNATTPQATGEYYLASATFFSDLDTPHDSYTVNQSNDGVFDITMTDPSPVDSTCNYRIAYTINHPYGSSSTPIRGPKSAEYTIPLAAEPQKNTLTISNYAYTAFADAPTAVSSFTYDVEFADIEASGAAPRYEVDGMRVYLVYPPDSTDPADSVLVQTVRRGNNAVQTGLTVTLGSVAPTLTDYDFNGDGLTVPDAETASKTLVWTNFQKAKVEFRACRTALVVSDGDALGIDSIDSHDFEIFNVPPIAPPKNFALSGGVIEADSGTAVSWDDTLAAYGTDVVPEYVLTLKEGSDAAVDVSGDIDEGSDEVNQYDVDTETLPPNTQYQLGLTIKLTGEDGYSWLGTTSTITFSSVSVAQSTATVSVLRDSFTGPEVGDPSVLKVSFGAATVTPPGAALAGGILNIVERTLVDNPSNSTDPTDVVINKLENAGADVVQAEATEQTYDLLAEGYDLGDNVNLQALTKAGVDYQLKVGDAAATTEESEPGYLKLADAPQLTYTLAGPPIVTLRQGEDAKYTVDNGAIIVPFSANTVGLQAQGLSTMTFFAVQDSDYTEAEDAQAGKGGVAIVVFCPSAKPAPAYGYADGPVASAASATDFLAAGETVTVTPEDLGNAVDATEIGSYTLALGTLDGEDASTLTFPANGKFNPTKPIEIIAIATTPRGKSVKSQTYEPTLLYFSGDTELGSGDNIALLTAVTSTDTDPEAPAIAFEVTVSGANVGSYNEVTKVVTAGSSRGTITINAIRAAYSNARGVTIPATTESFAVNVKTQTVLTRLLTDPVTAYLFGTPSDMSTWVSTNNNETPLTYSIQQTGTPFDFNSVNGTIRGMIEGATATVTISQAGNDNYFAAIPLTFTVNCRQDTDVTNFFWSLNQPGSFKQYSVRFDKKNLVGYKYAYYFDAYIGFGSYSTMEAGETSLDGVANFTIPVQLASNMALLYFNIQAVRISDSALGPVQTFQMSQV